MNKYFIELFKQKYENKFVVETNAHGSFIKFPAKNPDFGDVCIWEEAPDSYIVELGNFTHGHFEGYEGSEDENIKEAVAKIFEFLDEFFADNIICYKSKGAAGCYKKDESNEYDDCYYSKYGLFVWSGKFVR